MQVVTVHAAVGDEPEKMQPLALCARERFLQNRIFFQLAIRDRFVDASQILINNPASAEIQVADFGVAHLSFGQSDIEAARAQFSVGIFAIELIVKRGLREKGSVSIRFALRAAAGINSPTVANQQHDWT